jgi:hypothetical protein
MKKQIKDLELHELDKIIAELENKPIEWDGKRAFFEDCYGIHWYEPSSDPKYSWPIIERERIEICFDYDIDLWEGVIANYAWFYNGKTSLEAAMRCYVASKFGDEVDMDNLINK